MEEWQVFFGIPEKVFQGWEKSSQGSPLYWALKEGRVDKLKYLKWASTRYGLPILKNSFFQNVSMDSSMWKTLEHKGKWSKKWVPIYQWEGTVFCACVEPPDAEHLSEDLVPVLVDPAKLELCWEKIQDLQKESQPPLENKEEETKVFNEAPAAPPRLQTLIASVTKITRVTNLLKMFKSDKKTSSVSTERDGIFKLSKKYFSCVIVFGFHKDKFIPLQYSDSLSTPIEVSVRENSLFRLMYTSRREYHGWVVQNQTHIQFFASCGFKHALPKHISLVPVYGEGDNLLGAFMGISQSAVPSKHIKEINSWVKDLKKTLLKDKTRAA